ncbi:hypothetical protein RUND412_000495 [Rhizina undulata]
MSISIRTRPVLRYLRQHRNPQLSHSFHASPRPQFIETTLTTTHALLQGLHATTGLPWWAVIPATAFLLRLSVTTPLTIFSRLRGQKILALQPVLAAWQHHIAGAVRKSAAGESPQKWEKATRTALRAKRRELWARHGCQAWKMFLPFGQIPVWVVASMTLRGMTAGEAVPGWMKVVGGAFGGDKAEGVEVGAVVPQEAGFAEEGVLWFQDLLVADPLLILPLSFSFLLFANIELQAKQVPATTKGRRIFTNAMKVTALAVFPLTMSNPAAMTLYWTSSALYSLVQNIIIQRLYPLPESIKPCKPSATTSMGRLVVPASSGGGGPPPHRLPRLGGKG